jgi:hypothetical protein
VYSRHFANGGIQLYALTLVNLYIYLLAYLNWPQIVSIDEKNLEPGQVPQSLDTDEDESDSQNQNADQ